MATADLKSATVVDQWSRPRLQNDYMDVDASPQMVLTTQPPTTRRRRLPPRRQQPPRQLVAMGFLLVVVWMLVVAIPCRFHTRHPREQTGAVTGITSLSSSPTTMLVPTIGILSQPLHNDSSTYIAASYVKWLEAGGARSIAIPYDASTELVEDILQHVDGVLFPGGGAPVPPAAKEVWRQIVSVQHVNSTISNRRLLPLWGTCLGMEFLVQLATGKFDTEDDDGHVSVLESGYNATNASLPLLNVQRDGGLYRDNSIYNAVTKHNVTMNNHHIGLPPKAFASTPELFKRWKVTSVNLDLNGKPFVSTLEPIDPISFPVYGVQYHPEKNAFEYGLDFHDGNNVPYEAIDHSPAGLTVSIHMATYFVNVVRGNMRLEWENQQQDDNVPAATTSKTNFPLVYTYPRRVGTKFEEIYIVPPAAVSLSNDMVDSAAAAATLLPSASLRRRDGRQTNR